jgi:hypothetical protein
MEYLVEVQKNKNKFSLEILSHFKFVKTRPLSKKYPVY